MKDVKRLKRIVAVRTTQRDISAMRLLEAKRKTLLAEDQLLQAEQQLVQASHVVAQGGSLTQQDLERMDVARIAAWEEIAVWQVNKEIAEQAQESARSQVESQHLKLRQSERLGERAEKSYQQRVDAAERRQADDRASRIGKEPF